MNKININEINKIVSQINNNSIVAIPTDTIYGIGTNVESYQKIIDIKQRNDKPLAILCSSIEEMQKIISIPTIHINTLKALTPGALTIVGKTTDPKFNINKGFDTTGVRIPKHESLLKILKMTGPLVVSSANISGQSETYYIEDVMDIFKDKIDLYITNDQDMTKKASTVINIETLEIFRAGDKCNEIIEALKNDIE